ncbi:MAG TPA: hypothetical protein VMV15_04495 [Candidatus Binataceae bacterium]|nr:hypothetical protein [Candidatus Binataceae bacterium]
MSTTDLETKTRIMREFYRLRASGQPVPPEVYTRFVAVTNEGFTTGPEIGTRVPEFTLPDQNGKARALGDLTGPDGLLLVFYRSADW